MICVAVDIDVSVSVNKSNRCENFLSSYWKAALRLYKVQWQMSLNCVKP